MVTAASACCWCGSCLCVTAWQELWRLCALVTCFIVKMGRRWLQNQSVMFEEMKDASSQVLRASAVPCRERIPLYRVLTLSKSVLFRVLFTARCYATCEGDTAKNTPRVPEGEAPNRPPLNGGARWRQMTFCWREVCVCVWGEVTNPPGVPRSPDTCTY